jgi:hypothetical protein
LIEIARAERNAVADLNRAELARIEAENARLAQEAAARLDEAPTPTPEPTPSAAVTAAVDVTDENVQAIMVGFKTDPEYGKLFTGRPPYPKYHEELTYVIAHMEKTNPGMSKVQIRESIERNINTCSL